MLSLKTFPKSGGLIHNVVTSLMTAKDPEEVFKKISKEDLNTISENFDDYIMYIWLHLGDTRFNKAGYRNATDALIKKIDKT